MKAIRFHQTGGAEVLKWEDVELPPLGPQDRWIHGFGEGGDVKHGGSMEYCILQVNGDDSAGFYGPATPSARRSCLTPPVETRSRLPQIGDRSPSKGVSGETLLLLPNIRSPESQLYSISPFREL